MRAHQLVPSIRSGDAIGNQMMEIHKRLKAWGYESHLYATVIAPEMKRHVRAERALHNVIGETNDLLIYHYGIFHPNTQLFRQAKGHRVLIYHNITPATHVAGWSAELQESCQTGRFMLRTLTGCDLALGASEFSRQELVDSGFDADRTGVLPLFLGESRFEGKRKKRLSNNLDKTKQKNWLAVGSVAPHKGLDDAIRIFSVYNRYINPQSHFYIVGGCSLPSYYRALQQLSAALGVERNVSFSGRVTDAELSSYYEAADLFITASHHEGFCVPLLESMYFGVPILARKVAAIPETLGKAGILFRDASYDKCAQMAHLIITDKSLNRRIVEKQKQRLRHLGPSHAEMALQDALARLGLPDGR